MTSLDSPWTARTRLLHDVAVVELSSTLAGARCGAVLAQLGAGVGRSAGITPLIATAETQALMQQVLHGDKTTLADDEIDAALAAADIVIVESPREGHAQAERTRGLLRSREGLRPDAVLLVLSASGIEEDAAAHGCGLTSSAAAAMSFAIGSRDEEPLGLPYDIADYQTAANGVAAALVALLARLGSAGPVEVSSRDVLANLVGTLAQNYVPFGRPWRREGTRPSMSGGVYPCGLFPCKDGYVAIYCRGTQEWQGTLRAMGDPAWSKDPRFADPKRVAMDHADEADSHLMPWLAQFTRAQLMELGFTHGFPVAPVRYVREALADVHFAFRGSFALLEPGGATPALRVPAAPWRFQRSAACSQKAPSWVRPRPATADPSKALAGLRVLDFTWVWSGPMVTSLLADLGPEVLKIEHPSRPDSLRLRARPLRDGAPFEGPPSGEINPWFNQLNHAKKSVVIDLKSAEGRQQLLQLASDCDVVIENMRPGALASNGLGYHDLAARNPGLVMLSMSMAGQTGPLAQMKGYAGIMTSMAGLESVTGYASEAPDAPFTGMTMTALGDPNGAAHGIAALLAALHHRARTGEGTWIDLAQTDAILSILAAPIIESQLIGHVPVRGNAHPGLFPHGHFPCAGVDCWLALSIGDDEQWRRLVSLIGGPLQAFEHLSLSGRQSHREEIDAAVAQWTRAQSADDAIARLHPLAIACAQIASYEQMLEADWKKSRDLTRVVDHPYLGEQEVFVPPWRFGGRTAGVARPSPLLGQHTDEVLKTLTPIGAAAAQAQPAPAK